MNYFFEYVRNYLSLLFPVDLEEGECIRLCFLKQSTDGTKTLIRYANSFEEVCNLVLKYRNSYNCFVSLATYKNKEPYKRHVLFLDYDQKDFPDFTGAQDYTAYLKSKVPTLYNHMIVLSGSGGCHFYIACEEGANEEVCMLNKRLCRIANADLRACTTTQIVRIPGSYNLKREQISVKILSREENVIRYPLSKLDTLLKRYEDLSAKKCISTIPQKTEAVDISQFHSPYYCVNNMLANGVQKGERNFALGRITACLKKEMYTYEKSKEMVLDWNTRCDPPKEVSEVERDFNAYWFENRYKLLGCSIQDERKDKILKRYCNPELCKQIESYKDSNTANELIYLSSYFFGQQRIKKLSAYQYALLFISTMKSAEIYSSKILTQKLSMLFSDKTINNAICSLEEKKLIIRYKGKYESKKTNSKYNRDISINKWVLCSFLKNKLPTAATFKVYLALRYLLQTKKSATLDSISTLLGTSKSTVSEQIQALVKLNIIAIDKVPTEKGLQCNYYRFSKFDKASVCKLAKDKEDKK